jgi:hypothetical protein
MTSKLRRSAVPRRIAFRWLAIVALGASCAGGLLANHLAFAQSGSAPQVRAIPNGRVNNADIILQQNQAALAAQSILSLQATPSLPGTDVSLGWLNLYSPTVAQEALIGHTMPSVDPNPIVVPP